MEAEGATLERIASRLAGAERGVGFTGAGISTESGIPDFRSPGGIWTRYDPRTFTFQRYVAEPDVRRLAWSVRRESWTGDYAPNAGHRALARLESMGVLRGVITQNVDGLHQDAGSREVLELHGTSRWTACLSCGDRLPTAEVMARVEAGEDDPSCTDCGGILKTATVSFGQQLPPDVVATAFEWSVAADVFIVVGSSLVVTPASDMPAQARYAGAYLAIINREPTPLDHLADDVVRSSAGEVLTAIADRVAALRA